MVGSKTLLRSSLLALATLLSLATSRTVAAHPMGNFSISHYAAIQIERESVELKYFVDMAEIPTYQEIQRTGIVAQAGDPSLAAYLAQEMDDLGTGLLMEVDGAPVEMHAAERSILFTPGAGGLPTMKIGVVFRADLPTLAPFVAHRIHYQDRNFTGHTGWKEIIVNRGADLSLMSSSAPVTDRSAQLTNYPTDLLNSPPQDLEANVAFSINGIEAAQRPGEIVRSKPTTPSGAQAGRLNQRRVAESISVDVVTPGNREPAKDAAGAKGSVPAGGMRLEANRQRTPRSKFTELVSVRNVSFWFLLTAGLIAAGLGALHGLEPGHGKTIVAAYLVGSRGTPRHAVLLGLIVTAAHTAGVYLLGAITLYASRWIVPEQLYPWLGVVSGMTIAVLALYLFLRAWTGEGEDHSHNPGQSHSHWFTSIVRLRKSKTAYVPPATDVLPGETRGSNMPLRQLLTLGITGGMVPCPAALVVLLSALSLHRVGLGLFLIVAFSLGLAGVLIAIGLLMVHARQLLSRWKGDGASARRWLPVASSLFMLILGLGIAVRGAMSAGIGAGFSMSGHVVSFLGIVLLGFFLGMRHSTDPDHVVAVSTIVSRERSIRHAAMIGVLWGVGHTLTISVVGSLIILFGLAIPPRVGLSMEFCVALMLVLLGVLNLTGVLRWATEKFTPADRVGGKSNVEAETAGVHSGIGNRAIAKLGYYQLLRPLVIGLVHGLAGSAAVALLVLSTIHRPAQAIAYLMIFGVGTIAGMMLMTSAIALPIAYTGNRFLRAGNALGIASGIVSTAFGMFLIYQIGMVDGLFAAQVHWVPR
jgi:high-affinity nickel-transport protein